MSTYAAGAMDTAVDIKQEEAGGLARSVFGIQVLLALVVILYLLVVQPQALAQPAVAISVGAYVAMLALLGILVGFRLWRPQHRLVLGLVSMLAFITVLLGFTELHAGALANLYFLPIVASGLALGRGPLALTVALVTVCYLGLVAISGGALVPTLQTMTAALLQLMPIWLVAALTALLQSHIRVAQARIQALSDQDELTGLLNARAFTSLLAREHDSAVRYQRRYALLLVDIDNLKALNDELGKAAGNQALLLVTEALARVMRTSDVVARFGGDEFAVFLAETERDVAEKVAQRVRNMVFATTLQVGARMQRVQVSVGVASYPDDGDDPQILLAAAEQAMRQDGRLRKPPPPGGIVVRRR